MSLQSLTNQLNNLQIQKNKYTYRIFSTSTIPPTKIALCLADTNSIDSTTHFLDPKLLDTPSDKKYWIVLKNTSTLEEEITTEPLDKQHLKKWCEKFVNTNLFSNINLYGKYSFPRIRTPDPDSHLWEQTGFSIDEINFIATVVVDPSRNLSTNYDYVHICLKTPWLPRTYESFKQLKHSNSRKLVMYHEAIVKLLTTNSNLRIKDDPNSTSELSIPPTPDQAFKKAKDEDPSLTKSSEPKIKANASQNLLSYSLATSIHGENVVPEGQWHAYKIEGCFESSQIEKSPGSAVVQQVLSYLYPYLLLLDNSCNVDYQIIQPCKFAYTFYLQKLAGCKVWGAVNMCASDEALFCANDQYSFIPQNNQFVHNGELGMYIQNLSAIQMQQFLTQITKAIDNVKAEFEKTYPFAKKDPSTNIEYPLEDDTNREIYNGKFFKLKLQYFGLEMIKTHMSNALTQKQTMENTIILQNFFEQLLNAHAGNPFSHSLPTKTLSVVIDATIEFLSSVMQDFIENVKKTKTTVKPSLIKDYLENDIAPKTFVYDQGISFIKSCLGLNPSQWKFNIQRELGITTDQFVQNLFKMQILFHMFYNKQFFHNYDMSDFYKDRIIALIAQNNITFDGALYTNTVLNDKGYSSKPNESSMKNALVFKVFDISLPSHVFSWKD